MTGSDWNLILAANWEPLIFRGSPSNWDQANIVSEAIGEVRRQHTDFDELNSVMLAVAKGLIPDLSASTPAQYIEAVYCFGKFSNACAPLRAQRQEAVPMSTRKM